MVLLYQPDSTDFITWDIWFYVNRLIKHGFLYKGLMKRNFFLWFNPLLAGQKFS